MNNYRNNRKNRFKSNGDRIFRKRSIHVHKGQNKFNSNSDFKHRSSGRNNQNAAKLVEKYNNLAREAYHQVIKFYLKIIYSTLIIFRE